MKSKLITTISALTLTAFAGALAHADEAAPNMAWQEPGYVVEIVYATAPRFYSKVATAMAVENSTETSTQAWQEPGYEQEVVVARASRNEVLAAARREILDGNGWLNRSRPVWSARFMGNPTH